MTDLPAIDQVEVDAEELQVLEAIRNELTVMPAGAKNLIPILQKIQHTHGYLPRGGIFMVAEHLGLAPTKVFGVATFYNQFRFNPPGRNPIKVCLGTACHVKGGEIILENFARKLGIEEGETTKDREFSLERVACVGCCALAPVVVVGDKIEAYVTPSKVEGIVTEIEVRREMAAREEERDES